MALTMVVLLIGWFQPERQDAILGRWYTENDEAIVEVYRCGAFYCGKIVDLEEKVYPPDDEMGMAGQAKVDRLNPETGRRDQPIIGLVIVEGFTFDGEMWRGGRIYDPDRGKTYRCKMRLIDDGKRLYVRGFIGVSLLGRTTHWRRAD